MNIYIQPEYEVVRDRDRCIACRVCERQCANLVHTFDAETGKMQADSSLCVNCHRCVCVCPTHALKIVKSDDTYKINGNWSNQTINEVYRQANSGGVLLSSMGNPKDYRARRKGQTEKYVGSAVEAQSSDHVLGNELRFDQLQRARIIGESGGGAGHLLQYGRRRSAQRFLQIRKEYDRAGSVGAVRRI